MSRREVRIDDRRHWRRRDSSSTPSLRNTAVLRVIYSRESKHERPWSGSGGWYVLRQRRRRARRRDADRNWRAPLRHDGLAARGSRVGEVAPHVCAVLPQLRQEPRVVVVTAAKRRGLPRDSSFAAKGAGCAGMHHVVVAEFTADRLGPAVSDAFRHVGDVVGGRQRRNPGRRKSSFDESVPVDRSKVGCILDGIVAAAGADGFAFFLWGRRRDGVVPWLFRRGKPAEQRRRAPSRRRRFGCRSPLLG
mmetsp:Transcript_7955/g.20616  ORF Transcript_7955/g.20616 Transcript_7955/m.20616 type:complete len:248 (+) Transcript_7955:21-764(+)